MQKIFNQKHQKEKRKFLRNNSTNAEKKLWSHLRKSQLANLKFRRQQGIGPFIVDFYCPEIKLTVELDGEIHSTEEAREYDHKRDSFLRDHGITVLRFKNKQIIFDIDVVLHTIVMLAETIKTTTP